MTSHWSVLMLFLQQALASVLDKVVVRDYFVAPLCRLLCWLVSRNFKNKLLLTAVITCTVIAFAQISLNHSFFCAAFTSDWIVLHMENRVVMFVMHSFENVIHYIQCNISFSFNSTHNLFTILIFYFITFTTDSQTIQHISNTGYLAEDLRITEFLIQLHNYCFW